MGWSRQERIALHDKMVRFLPEVKKTIMDRFPSVSSVDLGMREVRNQPVEELVWRIYVNHKKPLSELRDDEVIPKEIAGLRTDVLTQSKVAYVADDGEYRPLWGGISISAFGGGYGTLGCLVQHTGNNLVHLLSNHHVIGSTNTFVVSQPGGTSAEDYCCCCSGKGIARVVTGQIGAAGALPTNLIDASIAVLRGEEPHPNRIPFTFNILQIGPVFGSSYGIAVGDVVRKRGRTSELTSGTVVSKTADVTISKDTNAANDITYSNNQIKILSTTNEPFAKGGDSGSAIVNNRNQVVGLLFASQIIENNPDPEKIVYGRNGYGNLIQNVEQELSVSVLSAAHAGHPETIPITSLELMPPPMVTAAPLTFLHKIEARLKETSDGRDFLEIVHENRGEVLDLINDNREVKIAWNRYQGPSYIGHLAKSFNEPSHRIPTQIDGYSLQNLLIKMSDVLERNGSKKLSQAVENYSTIAFSFADQVKNFDSIEAMLNRAFCPNCGKTQMLNDYAE